ncbi:MAG: 4-hydroxythreonine-4-phosphate dehydrogenase PdxA [Candidatus Omnitrophica bacterium]|nr:4-hydroxythreonine-4-phosphate dehydrogenase PdxA [Candidatus Omnitrophota bacterium]MBU1631551.1 4-hydroxythreonine-4-phosphate dehydrogenase PdxA [Candidatus Omnitrophota bacterium]MBU1767713.1 4-hydroxythreonine-4-phosphate dehydrogenase PdxA [Candidatus Omnitrophota bacterium]MBU1888765.1 4-hydroxythreonine-4-phosphate dehydrogenase PdxA [Candidatus Omnitrophota bacterium]
MLPIIGITIGDPAGIGGEIIIKSLKQKALHSKYCPVIIGDFSYLKLLIKKLSSPLKITSINKIKNRKSLPIDAIPVIDLKNLENKKIKFGICDASYGKASYEYIAKAIELASYGFIDVIVTAPINKESFHKAHIPYTGHTEMLAELTKTKNFAMMLVGGSPTSTGRRTGGKLRVVLVTRHIPIKNVSKKLTEEKIFTAIKLAHNAGKYFNIPKPIIGVCGLNPHSGEGGTIGDEEIKIIIPAIEKSKKTGINAMGPYASDTIFYKALKGNYDFVVAMFHDQGLIPLKTLYFDEGVNVTLGLPFIRTSPDHGTAYDIAGKGIANPKSMQEAIKLAIKMSRI